MGRVLDFRTKELLCFMVHFWCEMRWSQWSLNMAISYASPTHVHHLFTEVDRLWCLAQVFGSVSLDETMLIYCVYPIFTSSGPLGCWWGWDIANLCISNMFQLKSFVTRAWDSTKMLLRSPQDPLLIQTAFTSVSLTDLLVEVGLLDMDTEPPMNHGRWV